jgi:hypothetical protein
MTKICHLFVKWVVLQIPVVCPRLPKITSSNPQKIVNPSLATNRIGNRSRRLPLLVKNEKVLKTMYTHEQSEQNILWAILLTW